MSHALDVPGTPSIPDATQPLTWQDGQYRYRVDHEGDKSVYTVTDGADNMSLPIKWVFGAFSQTYLLEYQGSFYESRGSYYRETGALDLTMGDQPLHPKTVLEAMGRRVTDHEALTCFQCHSTNSVTDDRLQLSAFTPGVQCERCHIGASRHLESITHGKLDNVPPKLGHLTSEATSNFCGQCHRSWSEVVRSRLFGPINVRFQPYRLAKSKCFDGSDRRIGCTACHDPHIEIVRESNTYDSHCLACHVSSAKTGSAKPPLAKVCHVATAGCVTCHMPKVQLPGGHQTFTDHFIRIAKANEPYPD